MQAGEALADHGLSVLDGKTRMQRLQTAFKQIMDELSPNTNVGLGRYSYFEGGAVLVPVANIDTKVKDVLSEDIAISTPAFLA